MTGLSELKELKRLCPHRKWNFVRDLADHFILSNAMCNLKVEIDVDYRVGTQITTKYCFCLTPGGKDVNTG